MKMYINRELSWLNFNYRVLQEANDTSNTLNKFKFLSIFSSNLDEFFMVRLGYIKQQININSNLKDITSMSADKQFIKINKRVKKLLYIQEKILNKTLEFSKRDNIEIVNYSSMTKDEISKAKKYYNSQIFDVLTPIAINDKRSFPLLNNKMIYLFVKIKHKKNKRFVLIEIPKKINRLFVLSDDTKLRMVLVEDIIKNNINTMFEKDALLSISQFRITRNADVLIDDKKADNMLYLVEKSLIQRKFGEIIRVEILKVYDKSVLNILLESLKIRKDCVYKIDKIMDMSFMLKMSEYSNKLIEKKYIPRKEKDINKKNIFSKIDKNDLLFHFPYQSFDIVENFVEAASEDKNVLAIKMTLYRVNENSKVIKSLIKAAKNQKEVTVLVELKARFDEYNNIKWAKSLEKNGVNVVYGSPELKTHLKMLLVIKKDGNKIKKYLNISTGNYNSVTAKLYTDLSLFTANKVLTDDVTYIFNLISGFGSSQDINNIIYAPQKLRDSILKLIDNEIKNSRLGNKAEIKIIINSLIDKEIIDKLYEASSQGVKIFLIVRGICSLIPNIKGVSDNIIVKSIIGEFLEHSRVYIFKNSKPNSIYIGSADLMTRNLNRRNEILVPILNKIIEKRIRNIFNIMWSDNQKSWELQRNGNYIKKVDCKSKKNSQDILKG